MYSWKRFNHNAGFVGLMALIGFGVGYWFGPVSLLSLPPEVYPLPYHVAKYPGGISLRLAMVHDAIHERFAVHGKAYYEERNRRAMAALKEEEAKQAAGEKPSSRYYEQVDNLAVGLERLGRSGDAANLVRRKLAEQQRQGFVGRDLYTSYANLGTFVIHQQVRDGFADLAAAKTRLREGGDLLRKAIEVNPGAHFGREQWQLVLLEYMLTSLDRPRLVLSFDMIGDRLDLLEREVHYGRGSIFLGKRSVLVNHALHDAKKYLAATEAEQRDMQEIRENVRRRIRGVGAENDWEETVPNTHTMSVPFDEPTLGIVGMWRYGGGANPHFALALAEIMLRVGQRRIAWCAYERAAAMCDRISRGEGIARDFLAHCRARQEMIEKQLPAEEVDELRPRFQAELAFGQRYQHEYQQYEERRIGEGASIDDPHFYDAFDAEHGPIATTTGPEEEIEIETAWTSGHADTGLLFSGLFGFAAACCLWAWSRSSSMSKSDAVGKV
jgi:hypothetical protein